MTEQSIGDFQQPTLSDLFARYGSSHDVISLAPMMGAPVLVQCSVPIAEVTVDSSGLKLDGFSNLTPCTIAPSPIWDRVILVLNSGMGASVLASDIKGIYFLMDTEKSKPKQKPLITL